VAAAAGGRRPHRRLRLPAGALRAALSHLRHHGQLPRGRPGSARQHGPGQHAAAEPVCAGHLADRAGLEDRAGRARGALGSERRTHRLLDDELAELRHATRDVLLAEGGAVLAVAARHRAEGVARPRRRRPTRCSSTIRTSSRRSRGRPS
jgi:hypothetical protein